MQDRAEIIAGIRDGLAPNGHGARLLDAMFDRARRLPDYAADLQDWLDRRSWLMLRRAAAPFGDFHASTVFAGALYELDAAMSELRAAS